MQWKDLRSDTSQEKSNGPENKSSSEYFEIDKMNNIKIPNKHKFLCLFLINACFLHKNYDNFQHLLSCTKNNFGIIAISET